MATAKKLDEAAEETTVASKKTVAKKYVCTNATFYKFQYYYEGDTIETSVEPPSVCWKEVK